MEQELAAGLGEGQVAELVEDDEVHAGEVIGEPALASVAGLGFEPIDEIDDIVEPAARRRGCSSRWRWRNGSCRFLAPLHSCRAPRTPRRIMRRIVIGLTLSVAAAR